MPAPRYSIEEQEQRILDAATACIMESSILDFKMSAIAKGAGISMGSVYKHIQTKEDVLVALATRVEAKAVEVFSEVLSLPYSTPERLMAIHLMSPEAVHQCDFGPNLLMLASNEATLSRASEKWLARLFKYQDQLEGLFHTLLGEAIDSGELALSGESREALIDEIGISLWAMNCGFTQVSYELCSRRLSGIDIPPQYPLQPDSPIVKGLVRLVSTYEWREPYREERTTEICKVLEGLGYR
ncbi:hypothetical protein Mag101_06580 [Microbulbifer agarilyticus]|uniref:HTH tetR-type domain-containing protein n=1 Tax=Microbulbifer agarilyticus TaxID=260552 RepID=A0A1Q2M3V2_9GAMM|nr:TetR/AcrR family transcriptional regulator [Microbulbifer agarilyticus]AQQ67336.1 hypothetical protein Mag101_06580 [Microbulbifer agarilyticus]